ncbi:MAG: hypothetical protein JWL72_116 [Ilumatobacteraceae bacterium]|nr:hypothetical protein [Ilumatobacteraceae bacterium]MCU1386778.1 hypothetical protein [Ilumatobacteraceae bacterium]
MRADTSSPQRKKTRWHTARRYRNAQLTLNCLDELNVIADYRRSEELRLLLGDHDTTC